ncbi:MAG: hypothetical protein ISR65_18785 [Bacteriovoracaceae bacterium]|nr:hypothetical protein [Bacteriovoracaceae bacterium]
MKKLTLGLIILGYLLPLSSFAGVSAYQMDVEGYKVKIHASTKKECEEKSKEVQKELLARQTVDTKKAGNIFRDVDQMYKCHSLWGDAATRAGVREVWVSLFIYVEHHVDSKVPFVIEGD